MGLYQIDKPHTFVLGAEYHRPETELSTTLTLAIERAEQMKTPGTVWMSAPHGVYPVANFDGKGGVFNGSTTLTKASPEQILLLVDTFWSRAAMGMPLSEDAIGGLAFYREDPWQKSPVVPYEQDSNGAVRAFSLADAVDWNFQPNDLMSVGELVNQMRKLLTDKTDPQWEKRLLDRIEALALAAVASAPAIKSY